MSSHPDPKFPDMDSMGGISLSQQSHSVPSSDPATFCDRPDMRAALEHHGREGDGAP